MEAEAIKRENEEIKEIKQEKYKKYIGGKQFLDDKPNDELETYSENSSQTLNLRKLKKKYKQKKLLQKKRLRKGCKDEENNENKPKKEIKQYDNSNKIKNSKIANMVQLCHNHLLQNDYATIQALITVLTTMNICGAIVPLNDICYFTKKFITYGETERFEIRGQLQVIASTEMWETDYLNTNLMNRANQMADLILNKKITKELYYYLKTKEIKILTNNINTGIYIIAKTFQFLQFKNKLTKKEETLYTKLEEVMECIPDDDEAVIKAKEDIKTNEIKKKIYDQQMKELDFKTKNGKKFTIIYTLERIIQRSLKYRINKIKNYTPKNTNNNQIKSTETPMEIEDTPIETKEIPMETEETPIQKPLISQYKLEKTITIKKINYIKPKEQILHDTKESQKILNKIKKENKKLEEEVKQMELENEELKKMITETSPKEEISPEEKQEIHNKETILNDLKPFNFTNPASEEQLKILDELKEYCAETCKNLEPIEEVWVIHEIKENAEPRVKKYLEETNTTIKNHIFETIKFFKNSNKKTTLYHILININYTNCDYIRTQLEYQLQHDNIYSIFTYEYAMINRLKDQIKKTISVLKEETNMLILKTNPEITNAINKLKSYPGLNDISLNNIDKRILTNGNIIIQNLNFYNELTLGTVDFEEIENTDKFVDLCNDFAYYLYPSDKNKYDTERLELYQMGNQILLEEMENQARTLLNHTNEESVKNEMKKLLQIINKYMHYGLLNLDSKNSWQLSKYLADAFGINYSQIKFKHEYELYKNNETYTCMYFDAIDIEKNKIIEAKSKEEKQSYTEREIKNFNENYNKIKLIDTEKKTKQTDIYEPELYTQRHTYNGIKVDLRSFAIVVMMPPENYASIEENKKIHLPDYKKTILFGILRWLESMVGGDKILNYIIVNHEHGEKTNKCHIQAYANFEARLRCIIAPGKFKIGDNLYLIIAQKPDNEGKAKNYCKKKSDYVEDRYLEMEFRKPIGQILMDLNIKQKETEPKSAYMKLLTEPNITPERYLEIVQSNELSEKQRADLMKNYKTYINLNKEIVTPYYEEKTHSNWVFPQFALDFIQEYNTKEEKGERPSPLEYEKYTVYKTILYWFNKYCKFNDKNDLSATNRKKGLLFYGNRGIGKTRFCMSLCGGDSNLTDNPQIIHCIGNLAWSDFENKLNTAELIIFDDVTFLDYQKQMLKSLVVGQKTKIRSLYVDNKTWDKNVPVIILSNEISLLDWMLTAPEWTEDLVIVSANNYIGPEEFRPERKKEHFIDPWTQAELEKYRERKKKKFQTQYAYQSPHGAKGQTYFTTNKHFG